MSQSRAISTTLPEEQWLSVTVVLTLHFVGLDQRASPRLRSTAAIHQFMHDVRHSLGLS
jgi:hypothetical protein